MILTLTRTQCRRIGHRAVQVVITLFGLLLLTFLLAG